MVLPPAAALVAAYALLGGLVRWLQFDLGGAVFARRTMLRVACCAAAERLLAPVVEVASTDLVNISAPNLEIAAVSSVRTSAGELFQLEAQDTVRPARCPNRQCRTVLLQQLLCV